MIITAWRIYKPRHAATAFTGEGARRFGGRWNSKGVAVVYTASSLSLASLEMLVHLQAAEILKRYVVRSVSFSDTLVTKLAIKDLPKRWRESPPPAVVQRVGDDWASAATSAVLQVPSTIIESEHNFILNVRHADFKRIKLGRQLPFTFDPRLLKT